METILNEPTAAQPLTASNDREIVMRRLQTLTEKELQVCLLHFVDGRSQTLVAQWLGLTRQTVTEHIDSALGKVPELIPLRTLSQGRTQRMKLLHLSQLPSGDRERGPFNIDEV